jgi:hypothetical protein
MTPARALYRIMCSIVIIIRIIRTIMIIHHMLWRLILEENRMVRIARSEAFWRRFLVRPRLL